MRYKKFSCVSSIFRFRAQWEKQNCFRHLIFYSAKDFDLWRISIYFTIVGIVLNYGLNLGNDEQKKKNTKKLSGHSLKNMRLNTAGFTPKINRWLRITASSRRDRGWTTRQRWSREKRTRRRRRQRTKKRMRRRTKRRETWPAQRCRLPPRAAISLMVAWLSPKAKLQLGHLKVSRHHCSMSKFSGSPAY